MVFNVALQNPDRRVTLGQRNEALTDGISAAAAFAESIGIPVGSRLRYGCQSQHVQGLWNAKTVVCVSPIGLGAGPFTISKYEKAAKALAKKEVALAGAGLANRLNLGLK